MMRCTYERTIFESSDTGFCVVVFATQDSAVPAAARSTNQSKDGRIRFTATGYRLPVTKTIDVELDGRWENTKRGLQFAVESFVEIVPKTRDGIIGYLSSGLINGIGEKTARIIVGKFGLNTLEVLDEHPEKLLEIKGITPKKLEKITASYTQSKAMRDIVTFLSPFGISVKKAVKIQKEFGAQTMEILKTRPFELCAISGFGFKTVDSIARKANCELNDHLRIRGAIQYILDEITVEGHLFLPKEELCDKAHVLLNEGFGTEAATLREVQSELYHLVVKRQLLSENGNVYKPKSLIAEAEAAKRIAELLTASSKSVDITKELEEAQQSMKLILCSKQAEAVKMCFAHNMAIITGGPGTGKTTVLKIILEVYNKIFKGKIMLTAPTGRASRRMSESTGYPDAKTLHSALGLITDEDDDFLNSNDPVDADFVIVDEFSMVDMRLANELFSRIQDGTKVLLVGDADQLPSVGAGNVFRELINCGLLPVTFLDVVFRQSGTSRIALNAHAINENQTKLLYGPDFEFIPCETAEDAAELIQQQYLKETALADVNNVQILSPFKSRGEACVKKLNEVIRELINPSEPAIPELKIGARVFRQNDRVLQTKNKGEISNGDVGFVKAVYIGEDNDSTLTIEFSDSRIVEYGKEDLDIIDLSYAMTIHKSQGSEYDTVILPILGSFKIILRRNLIYTAITRARKKVILVGQKQALYMAIHKNDIDKRNTLLGERILRCHAKLFQEQPQKQAAAPPRQMKLSC